MTESNENGESIATVVAARGHRLELATADGQAVPARTKGKRLRVVCNDNVIATPLSGEDDWLVTEIAERRNELRRVDARGRSEVLAANLDQLIVVCAPVPAPDFFIVDRYLCAAELMSVSAAVVFNKSDIDVSEAAEMSQYVALGYPVVRTSATQRGGIDELLPLLDNRTSMLVGQSGTGKSSLINVLAPDASQRIGEISAASREGRHTTVAAERVRLPRGGYLVDSPGVRDFAPWIDGEAAVQRGFREIHAASERCRFVDCRHFAEPNCAVRGATATGEIPERRYRSYRRLLNLARKLGNG